MYAKTRCSSCSHRVYVYNDSKFGAQDTDGVRGFEDGVQWCLMGSSNPRSRSRERSWTPNLGGREYSSSQSIAGGGVWSIF